MCLLCLACCWLGYLPRAHPALIEKLNVQLHTSRFLHGGIVLVVIGFYFMQRFSALSEDDMSTQMSGLGTIYLFFGGLIYPGLPFVSSVH